jgi:hypothetical protein
MRVKQELQKQLLDERSSRLRVQFTPSRRSATTPPWPMRWRRPTPSAAGNTRR